MKRLFPTSLLAILLALGSAATQAESNAEPDPKQMLVLVKAIQAQQAVMAANQAKIDEKIAAVAETVRVARIYSSRGGR